MEESSSGEDSITDEENKERKPEDGKRCWGRLSRSRCCWEAVVQSLVCFLIATLVFLFFLYIRSKDLDKADLCTTRSLAEGLVLVTAPVGVALIFMVIHWRFKPIPQKTDLERRTDQRLHDVVKEKEVAGNVLSQLRKVELQDDSCVNGHHDEEQSDYDPHSDLDDDEDEIYHKEVPILELGSRLQKYWTLDDSKTIVTSTAKRSQLCKLTPERFDEVNKFLSSLDHPHIQKKTSVKLHESEEGSQVIISQPFWRKGSLRDFIHKVMDPMANWDEKYRADSGRPLATEKVALYGSQILQAMMYLYKQKIRNLRPLGQVQSGNIFMADDNNCVLSGYENLLLSYRTSLYGSIAHYNLLEFIDIIMFGHVVYEMCTGHALSNVIPTEQEYERVEDEECLEILRYIFKRNRKEKLTRSIKKISKHKFFLGISISGKSTKHKNTENIFESKSTSNATSAQGVMAAFIPGNSDSSSQGLQVGTSKKIGKGTKVRHFIKKHTKSALKSITERTTGRKGSASNTEISPEEPEEEEYYSDSEIEVNRQATQSLQRSDSWPSLSHSMMDLTEGGKWEKSAIASGGATVHDKQQKSVLSPNLKEKLSSNWLHT